MSPNYFDLQVNGYGGVDFNTDALTAEGLHRACTHMRSDGVAGFLLTLITEKVDILEGRLRNIARFLEADELARELVAGFHVEGPFISPRDGYRGAHPLDAVKTANVADAGRLLDAAGGLLRLVTLAPECDPGFVTTQFLCDSGVRVAAGHTDASLDQLKGAVQHGLSLFTHLGNGCPMQMHRHDNIVQRALSLSDDLWLCFIADGVHVPFAALGNYLRAAKMERCCVVTDAVAPAGLGPGVYTVGRWELLIGEDMVARAPDGSHFVGAAITMPASAANLAANLNLSPASLDTLLAQNPRRAMGLAG